MTNCTAKEADFTEADLRGGIFTGGDFEGSFFSKTNLEGADFRDAKNYSIDVRYAKVKKAKFSLPEGLSLLSGLEVSIE